MNIRTSLRSRGVVVAGMAVAAVAAPLTASPPAAATVPAAASTASLCAPPADSVAPVITRVRLSRRTINLSRGQRTVKITVTAHDSSANGPASGITRIGLDAFNAQSNLLSPQLKLVRGSATNGTWTATLTVPPGVWKIRDLFAYDTAGNLQNYTHKGRGHNAGSPTDFVLQQGWQTSFRTTGHLPRVHHSRPGGMTSFGFTPRHVNTTKHRQRVHVTATFARPAPTSVVATFKGGSVGRQHFNGIQRDVRLTRGADGIWRGSTRIGIWEGNLTALAHVTQFYGGNVVPFQKTETTRGLMRRGLPATLRVTSREDDTTPVLTDLSITPSSVDTTSGAQHVTVTATAHDQTGTGMAADAILTNPTGVGPGSDLTIVLARKPGTDTFVGTGTLRQCVPGGTWQVQVGLGDHAKNRITYTPNQLAAAHLPSAIHVTSSPGDIEPPRATAVTSVADHTMTLAFSEGVRTVDASTLNVDPLSPAAARFHPVPITAITCSDGTSTVDCSGSHGLVTSAVLTIPQLTSGTQYSVFANVNGVAPQLTDGNGNPLDWSRRVDRVKAS
jgi:hypothetical protein